jgi:hypothetical protein
MSAQPNYARMPGFGDLPGDPNNPNSPDYIEPDNEQAIAAYAAQLVREDEVEALVLELYEASSAILSALSRQPARAPSPSTVTFMQRLRRLVQSVEASA